MNLGFIMCILGSLSAFGNADLIDPQLAQQQQTSLPPSAPTSPNSPPTPLAPASPNLPDDIKLPAGPAKAGPFTQQMTGVNNSKELEKKILGRTKDPFMLPNHLYLKIKRKLGDIQGEGYIDEGVAPQLRWALKRYKLIAIIWNVKRPKAIIADQKEDTHLFYLNDRIGNNEGVITSINDGEVLVNEKGTETRLIMNR